MKLLLAGKSYLIALFLMYGCSGFEQSSLNQANMMTGLASPILLSPEETTININDWILNPDQIDSVTVNSELSLEKDGHLYTLTGNLNSKLGNLTVWSSGMRNDILLKASEKRKVDIYYQGEGQNVRIKGEFNAWNVNEGILTKLADGRMQYSTFMNPGRYQYVLVVDDQEMPDPLNDDTIDNGMGGLNSLLVVPGAEPEQLPDVTGKDHNADGITLHSPGNIDGVFAYYDNILIDKYVSISGSEIKIKIPNEARSKERSHIRLWAFNEHGISNDVLIPLDNGQVLSDVSEITRNDKEASVMYFLMLDRFNDGNTANNKSVDDPNIHPKANYYGGDLAGVTQKLKDGYFSELGINTIWLSPITQNPETAYGLYPTPKTTFSGYHGYWPVSSSQIDYRFGTDAELKTLVDVAHDMNVNVILDYVANHVHEEHPLYKEHPDWATSLYLPDGSLNTERWDDQRLTTWFDTFLPTLDLSRPEVVDPMTDSALYWLEKFNLDGFRHDATKHIPLIFWRQLTQKVKKSNAAQSGNRVLQIGETYGSRELINSYISSGMLDAQFDFNLYDDAVHTFARDDVDFSRLTNSLKESINYYGDHNLMGYITGNQDRARFISYADGSLRFDEDSKLAGWTRKIELTDTLAYHKLASLTAFMMSIPGIPVLYYGDEIGMPGGNDPDNRRMMKFNDLDQFQSAHKERIALITQIRRSNLAMIYGETRIIRDDPKLLIIERKYFSQSILCVFNKNNSVVSINAEDLNQSNQTLTGLLSNEQAQETIRIAPYSCEFIQIN